MDCANGAASALAGRLLDRLGVRHDLIGAAPNGVNINVRCGSTHLEHVAAKVAAGGYDLGLAFDGDADRLLCVDAAGSTVDGDHILAILARDLLRTDGLPGQPRRARRRWPTSACSGRSRRWAARRS